MLKFINVKNLRSIKSKKVEIAPLTILYGTNGSGKSTLMHSLSFFRNIVLNPNQEVNNFFNLGFASFGGFEQLIFNHASNEQIEFKIGCVHDSTQVTYSVRLDKKNGRFELKVEKPWNITLEIETAFPYPADQQQPSTVKYNGTSLTINWNGIIAQVKNETEGAKAGEIAQQLAIILNSPVETLKGIDFVHLKRGFSKPHYGIVSLNPTIVTEDEVATLLAQNAYLESDVSYYIDDILQRDLRVRMSPGTTIFQLNATDRATGLATELVNDGFGINQVVYLLTKCLQKDVSCICIEEPEIHLHPKALRNLANGLIKLIKEEHKTMIISTHSEHFILAVLGAVSKGYLKHDEVSFYLCTKDKKKSKFEHQHVNAGGQIEGGLVSFMEGELEDLKDILSLSNKKG